MSRGECPNLADCCSERLLVTALRKDHLPFGGDVPTLRPTVKSHCHHHRPIDTSDEIDGYVSILENTFSYDLIRNQVRSDASAPNGMKFIVEEEPEYAAGLHAYVIVAIGHRQHRGLSEVSERGGFLGIGDITRMRHLIGGTGPEESPRNKQNCDSS